MHYQGPTLTVDKQKCIDNITSMVEKAKQHKLDFRPHFKAHQSYEIGEWFRQAGVDKITVSSIAMAEYFARKQWNDITVSFPISPYDIEQVNQLSKKIKLTLVVSRYDVLIDWIDKLENDIDVYVEIDTGHNRTGVDVQREQILEKIITTLSSDKNRANFVGFFVHAGHSYHSRTKHGIFSVHFDSMLKLKRLKAKYVSKFPELKISIGDTPTAMVCDDFREVNEIRPGSFIFFDAKHWKLGVCMEKDIAVRMVCPVIAKHRMKNELVIHGGANHFSLKSITNIDGKQLYGRIYRIDENGERILLNEMNYLHHLSQDHGMIRLSPAEFMKIKVGDSIEIIPVDSCMALHTMGWMEDEEGNEIEIMPRWVPKSRNKNLTPESLN